MRRVLLYATSRAVYGRMGLGFSIETSKSDENICLKHCLTFRILLAPPYHHRGNSRGGSFCDCSLCASMSTSYPVSTPAVRPRLHTLNVRYMSDLDIECRQASDRSVSSHAAAVGSSYVVMLPLDRITRQHLIGTRPIPRLKPRNVKLLMATQRPVDDRCNTRLLLRAA